MKGKPEPTPSGQLPDPHNHQPCTLVISLIVRSTQDKKQISKEEVKALRARLEQKLISELNYQHLRPNGETQYRLEAM